MLQRQQTKAGLSRLVVDESRADCRSHWGRDELRQLFSLNTTDACDTFREEAAQYARAALPLLPPHPSLKQCGGVGGITLGFRLLGKDVEIAVFRWHCLVQSQQGQPETSYTPSFINLESYRSGLAVDIKGAEVKVKKNLYRV